MASSRRSPYRRARKRRRDELLPALATGATIVLGAWVLSWWIVPLAALVAGALWSSREDVAQQAMWGAIGGWLLLLLLDSVHGRTWAMAQALGGVLFLPYGLVIVATLLFAAGLAWSAATVAAIASTRVRRRK